MSSSHLIPPQTEPREDGPLPRLGNRKFKLSYQKAWTGWQYLWSCSWIFCFLFMVLDLDSGLGLYLSSSLIRNTGYWSVCVQEGSAPSNRAIASCLLASFPEAPANCQERPNWVTCIGRLGPGVGVTATSLWVTGSLRWLSRLLSCVAYWTLLFLLCPLQWDWRNISEFSSSSGLFLAV